MQFNKLLALCCATAIFAFTSVSKAADVVIGVPNWPSVQATAHVLKVALENKLGLEVELKSGSNTAVFKAMDAGSIHVHPEFWLPNVNHLKRQYIDGKKTVKMHPSGPTGMQGMCTTRGTAERTGIANLKDLKNPEIAKKFDTNSDGKGEVWIGANGWGSTPIERIRARSYGYDKTMTLKVMEESAGLVEVENAVKQNKNIVFFCYAPHHIFATHDLIVLKEPAYDPAKWIIVPPSPEPGWLERSSAPVAWDVASLNIGYAASLEKSQPQAAAMLSKVSLDTGTLSMMSSALAVDKQDPSTFAANWVAENAATVDSWFQ